jgi:hypothetical protein
MQEIAGWLEKLGMYVRCFAENGISLPRYLI